MRRGVKELPERYDHPPAVHFASAVTKTEIIERLAAGTGLTRIETEAVVNGFLAVVGEALTAGEPVEIRGFGSFRIQHRKGRTARNPQTNEAVEVADRYTPVFRPSRDLRDAVDAAAQARDAAR